MCSISSNYSNNNNNNNNNSSNSNSNNNSNSLMSTTVKEERTARSGSLMLPKRMMNGASNAGLGTMDGGVYGHMRSLKGHRVEDQQQQYDSVTGRRIAAPGHQPSTNIEEEPQNNSRSINEKGASVMNGSSKSPFVGDDRYLIDMIERDIIHRQLGVKFEGEYLSEGASIANGAL